MPDPYAKLTNEEMSLVVLLYLDIMKQWKGSWALCDSRRGEEDR